MTLPDLVADGTQPQPADVKLGLGRDQVGVVAVHANILAVAIDNSLA